MSADLFNAADLPFNLASETLDESLTAEGEARVRVLAESEARKAQRGLQARCTECGRVFDLANEMDAQEFHYGHDCEV